jgi:nitrite reductase (NADH) large subunit
VDTREVQTTARTLGWDALVFATGSTPFVPPIPGCDAPHVFTFRPLEDTRAIGRSPVRRWCWAAACSGLRRRQRWRAHNVTVHRGPWLMEQQLDEQAGVLLEEALAARGVRCELASGIAAIDGNSVTLLNGRSVAAARVVLATGVQPNVVLAQASGIRCARHRGGSPDANLRAGRLRHWRVLRN